MLRTLAIVTIAFVVLAPNSLGQLPDPNLPAADMVARYTGDGQHVHREPLEAPCASGAEEASVEILILGEDGPVEFMLRTPCGTLLYQDTFEAGDCGEFAPDAPAGTPVLSCFKTDGCLDNCLNYVSLVDPTTPYENPDHMLLLIWPNGATRYSDFRSIYAGDEDYYYTAHLFKGATEPALPSA